MERIESARATLKNSTYDKGDGGANTTVVLNACGASSRLRRGFPSSSSHGYYHGSPQGVASRVRKGGDRISRAGADRRNWVVRFFFLPGEGSHNIYLIVYTRETRHFGRSIRGKVDIEVVYRARSNFWIFVKIRYRVREGIFMIFFFFFERLKVREIMISESFLTGMFRYLLLFFFYFVIFPRIFFEYVK